MEKAPKNVMEEDAIVAMDEVVSESKKESAQPLQSKQTMTFTSTSANASGASYASDAIAVIAPVKTAEKIKKTADINLTVDDYKAARAAIEKIVN